MQGLKSELHDNQPLFIHNHTYIVFWKHQYSSIHWIILWDEAKKISDRFQTKPIKNSKNVCCCPISSGPLLPLLQSDIKREKAAEKLENVPQSRWHCHTIFRDSLMSQPGGRFRLLLLEFWILENQNNIWEFRCATVDPTVKHIKQMIFDEIMIKYIHRSRLNCRLYQRPRGTLNLTCTQHSGRWNLKGQQCEMQNYKKALSSKVRQIRNTDFVSFWCVTGLKKVPPPVVAMVTNISSGQTQTISSTPALFILFHFILESTFCSNENYLLLRCIYFNLTSFFLWVVPLMSPFLFHDISWSEQSVVILRRPTSFASCWPLCRHFCHLFHLPANLFIAVRLN